ncbi:MAG: PAS domain-containing protein [Halobacteriales archaeon]|nr:PAS domain-containing protein [Halobacteriales archaeon]
MAPPTTPASQEQASRGSARPQVVAIGASAGWFEAFTELLHALPADTGLAFVLVVHLDPRHESRMSQVLQRMTAMPVQEVEQDMPVLPDHVYIIPANAQLALRNGALHLAARDLGKPNTHVIDRFFRSVAEDAGPRALGVVLSGALSDGTEGLRHIRAAGGFTFAQSLESAKYREMPWNAISSGSVDFVMPPQEIAAELARIARQGPPDDKGPPIEGEDLGELLKVLRNRTGMDFSQYKRTTVTRRIHRRIVATRRDSVREYTELVRTDPREARVLHEELLIHVTRFFREAEMYDALRERILPGLVAGRSPEQPIRAWVAGCASGEETYSVAVLLLEYLQGAGLNVPVQVFGTDLSEKAVRQAREGSYPETIADDVPPERLIRFFERIENGYRVSKTVRGVCVFAVHNVTNDPPFSNMDIVSCRNVLVYMEPELQRRVLATIHYALKPGGYLLLGSSESVGRSEDLFEAVDKDQRIYVKRNVPTYVLQQALPPRAAAMPRPVPARGLAPATEQDVFREADRMLLERSPHAAVVLNEHLEVLHFRGGTGRYLEHTPGPASLSIVKMARDGLGIELRKAVEEAQAQRAAVRREDLRLSDGHSVTLEAVPLDGAGTERYTLVVFQEEGRAPRGPREAGERRGWLPGWLHGPARSPDRDATRAAQQRELEETRTYLQRLIEDYEATTEELRSANEEAVSTNEELQSANEELETAKEELQSTNEELTTLNEELQQRNADVQRVNNDLLNLLHSVGIPIIMLGPDLRIRRFTPSAQQLLNLIPTDIGRPLTDLRQPFLPDLRGEVLGVLHRFAAKAMDVHDPRGHAYRLNITPYRTSDSRVDGVVLVFLPVGTPTGPSDGHK